MFTMASTNDIKAKTSADGLSTGSCQAYAYQERVSLLGQTQAASREQVAGDAGVAPGFDVALLVADHEAAVGRRIGLNICASLARQLGH